MATLERDLDEKKKRLRAFLLVQTRILDGLIYELAKYKGDEESRTISDTVVLMVQALGVSIHSLLKLTRDVDMGIRDCFGIARSIAELSVNIAYIAASSSDVALRCQRHALQKTFRDLSRESSIGGLQMQVRASSVPPIEAVPGLAEALSIFTDKKGREIKDWTPLNIDKRISVVRQLSEPAATALAGAVFTIYRHSSELLHGTYFSIVYYWRGARGEQISREKFEERWVNDHFVAIFTAAFFGAGAVIEACSAKFELPQMSLHQKALQKSLQHLADQF